MATEYKLNSATIRDIIDKVPMEKWDEVIDEMKSMVNQTGAVVKLVGITAEAMGMKASEVMQFPEEITWIDDGLGQNTVHMRDGESGDNIADLVFEMKNKGNE